jgi:hypothetical protein
MILAELPIVLRFYRVLLQLQLLNQRLQQPALLLRFMSEDVIIVDGGLVVNETSPSRRLGLIQRKSLENFASYGLRRRAEQKIIGNKEIRNGS